MYTSLADLSDSQKEEMVASLACLLVGQNGSEEGITADSLKAVADASGNSLSPAIATLYSSVASQVPNGVKSYMLAPGGGGGGGGGGAASGGAPAAAAAAAAEPEEEEAEAPAVDMFGGGGGGGGDY
ncbi:hypothetical protein FisN_3Hh075 [Fistulifera solaris]|uniref:Large subunit ribosomal protein LP1 n=1 Tax=Fistulifera solaris TaxID=1519565 RepID=A0A1Z5JNJ9_FISSO|nr:hypothetical protein FisN_3Hh075 [Fistulifera solaris]|eukprot:GAX15605.1 hypothetical protein FisN_3Hh075 [Fistulifera solaris]